MAKANYYEQDGTSAATVELPASLFGVEVNQDLIHDAVVAYMANQRQGSASTKERSDVRGGGRKPYRQKGTGRARAGTIRSPIWRGGGTVFGPHPRSYRKSMTKRARRLALRSSLTSRADAGDILVVKGLDYPEPKTRNFASMLKNMEVLGAKMLVILDKPDRNTILSIANIPRVKVTQFDMVNTYDVVWADKILVTSDALKKMEEVFA